MQPDLSIFLQAAMDVGLADRLAVLRDDATARSTTYRRAAAVGSFA